MKKIIIIGGGVAGISALWALHQYHDVILLEANREIGGHAYTHHVTEDGNTISVDMGVEYLHERLSPNLFALMKQLKIPSYIAPLSFIAFEPKQNRDMRYWSNQRLSGELHKQLLNEMDRFQSELHELALHNKDQLKSLSVRDFLTKGNYSHDFAQKALLPLLTTFSGCNAPSLDYSLLYVMLSFNMNLLSFFTSCHWRKLRGGITQYLNVLQRTLEDNIHVNSTVSAVEKVGNKHRVHLNNEKIHDADVIVFACQADIALRLLSKPTVEQQKILGTFDYVDVQSCLHSDTQSLNLPKNSSEYFQFELAVEPTDSSPGYLTRVVDKLSPYNGLKTPLFVSFDRTSHIDPMKIISLKKWRLPKLRPRDLWNKLQVRQIQGINDLWFCGTDYSLSGHEGAMVSGLVIANRLGAPYPFKDNWLANAQFNTVKQFMGVYSPLQKLTQPISQKAYIIGKKLKLHKHFAHHIMSDLLF